MKREILFRTCVFGGYNKDDVHLYISRMEEELANLESRSTAGQNRVGNGLSAQMQDDDDVLALRDEADGLASFMREPEQTPEVLPVEKPKEKPADSGELLKAQRKVAELEEKLKAAKAELKAAKEELEQKEQQYEAYEEDYKAIKNVLLNARVDAGIIVAKAQEKAKLIVDDAQKRAQIQAQSSVAYLVDHLKENQMGLDTSRLYLEKQIQSIDHIKQEMEKVRENIEKLKDASSSMDSQEPEESHDFSEGDAEQTDKETEGTAQDD